MTGKILSERRTIVGEIAEKDGMLCIQVSGCCWYPIGGNSGLAVDFEESNGEATREDIGRKVYRVFRTIETVELEARA